MTTKTPTALEVAEDSGKSLHEQSTDELWARREEILADMRTLSNERDAINAVLWARAKEAKPEVETAGTMVLAGATTQLTVGADREWSWIEAELLALQGAKDPQGQLLLTAGEYGDLVKWEPKVDGRLYNTLMKRGGFVEEALKKCRTLKSARPTFDAKARR